jgi:hypothetical protein
LLNLTQGDQKRLDAHGVERIHELSELYEVGSGRHEAPFWLFSEDGDIDATQDLAALLRDLSGSTRGHWASLQVETSAPWVFCAATK